MTSFLRSTLIAVAALSFCVTLSACDSGSDDPVTPPVVTPPGAVAPTFSIASQVVPLTDGTQGLQFAFTPSADVQLTRVNIQSPVGAVDPFNANNNVYLSGQAVALQDANEAYARISGNWTFTFIGRRSAEGGESFNVAVPLQVSALTEAPPSN